VTVATLTQVTGKRLPRKTRDKLASQATELVGIVPFDWEVLCGGFVMFFGVDTIEFALAAQGRLQGANFDIRFWTTEEGLFVAAKVLERIEKGRSCALSRVMTAPSK
jgi:hypothetical protein